MNDVQGRRARLVIQIRQMKARPAAAGQLQNSLHGLGRQRSVTCKPNVQPGPHRQKVSRGQEAHDNPQHAAGQRIGGCKPKSVPTLTEFLGHVTIIMSSSRCHAKQSFLLTRKLLTQDEGEWFYLSELCSTGAELPLVGPVCRGAT